MLSYSFKFISNYSAQIRNTRTNLCGCLCRSQKVAIIQAKWHYEIGKILTVSSEQHKSSIPWSAKQDKLRVSGGWRITTARLIGKFSSKLNEFLRHYLWLLSIVQHSSSVGINMACLVFDNSIKVFDKPIKARTKKKQNDCCVLSWLMKTLTMSTFSIPVLDHMTKIPEEDNVGSMQCDVFGTIRKWNNCNCKLI
jgi:hypothetical protein